LTIKAGNKSRRQGTSLNQRSTMRRPQRLIAAAILIAFSGALAGCSSGFGSFDPSDLLDFLDTKKKLPGDRKPVFPDGVPGLEQGVPKDLYKGAQQDQQQQQQQNANAAPVAPAAPPPEEPKPKQASKSKAKGKQPAATAAAPPAEEPAAEPNGEAVPEEDATPAAPPPPKPAKKLVRRRTTAPPPDQSAATQSQPGRSAQSTQQSPAAFPAPLPAGTFTR
jgi:hypothetical protein